MSIEKAMNYLTTFIAFVVLIIALGALFPQYFGAASDIITQNLGTLTILVILSIIIYILAGRER